MRNSIGLLAAAVTAAALVGTAATPAAHAAPVADPGTAAVADSGTGSAAVDYGSSAAQSAVALAQRGDVLGVIVLLGVAPFYMLTGGICQLVTASSFADPCAPTRYGL
ncbi:hypothetical protein JK358_30365 [Nocardia sp. 2]|uniref:DUF732 domain-containing protein n=1 Tax=Nocardia acididurans TaxID=2802282 RepID=A0ABS1MF48_9NOCA|nr:hypothetical protein [Nocardia acididurans]MBL1078715.1 hypothetical protein [Nocardia acididurans]